MPEMLIVRGWGGIVPVIIFASSLAENLLSNAIASQANWEKHAWPLATALFVGGIFNEWANAILHRKPSRVFVDEESGQRFFLQQVHDFLFLRPRWWALICVVGAVVVLATDFATGKA